MKCRKRHFVKNEEENKTVLKPTLEEIIKMLKTYISSLKINESEMEIEMEMERRIDSINTTIIRSVNKIPKMILKMLITEHQLKSKNISQVFEDYKRCFNEGFMSLSTRYIGIINDQDSSLFIDFIKLSFPPNKVIKILNNFFGESLDKLQFVEQSRKSTKKSVKKNKAFCMICRIILEIVNKEEIGICKEFLHVLPSFACY